MCARVKDVYVVILKKKKDSNMCNNRTCTIPISLETSNKQKKNGSIKDCNIAQKKCQQITTPATREKKLLSGVKI